MRLLFLFLLLVSSFNLFAQLQGESKLDSLLTLLKTEKEDSGKVKTLAAIALYYRNTSPLKVFPYANDAIDLAKKISWKEGIAKQYDNLGQYINDTGNYPLAREQYNAAYQINLALNNKKGQAQNLNNTARSYQREGNYTQATDHLFKALTLAEAIQDNELIGVISTNLVGCFITQKNYAKAVEYAEKTEKYTKLTNNIPNIIKSEIQLGLIKSALKDTAAAKMYLENALKTSIENHDPVDEANVLVNLATLYYPDYKKEAVMMERVKTILDEINPSSVINLINSANLGDTYINIATTVAGTEKNNFLQKAEANLLRAKTMAEQSKATEYLSDIYQMLVHLEEVKGNYKAALQHYKQFTSMNDSLFSQDKKNEIAGLEGKHSLAIKDDEIALNKLTLANQRKTQWGLIAGVALLLIIGGLLYWQSRSRKKTNTTLLLLNNQLDDANKVKARFFSILSHDLRSPIVNLVHFLHLQKDSPNLLSAAQQAAQSQQISESAEDLLNNMEAMLLWSKEQMASFKPNIKEISVADLFSYIEKFFAHTQKVSITFTAMPGLKVASDENYLRTIMQNLTSNAIRALKDTTDASVEWSAVKENGKTMLSITDNGPGIAPEQVKVLFDDSVTSNAKSGLGLHLIRDLAKAIQYKITVKSQTGHGATFTLSPVAA